MTIGIIAMLASIALASVMYARTEARSASAFATVRSVQTVAMDCAARGANLSTPSSGVPVCVNSGAWPSFQSPNWLFGSTGACVQDLDVSDGDFTICAYGDGVVVTCTILGCTRT